MCPVRTIPDPLAADPAGIAAAAELLRRGGLVAFPTETVYGLGADATNPAAVARVFSAKGRPQFNPLIAHFPDADAAFADVAATPLARHLAAIFWPGPLTLVLSRRPGSRVAPLAAAGLDTLAVRVPLHPLARTLLREVGRPVAAPSANPSGRISPTEAAHVLEGLAGRIDAVLDGGPCAVGLESSVVDLTGPSPTLLRPGGIPLEALQQAIGPFAPATAGIRAPGQLASHYAPSCDIRLDAASVGPREALLAFGPPLAGAASMFQLSEARDPVQAASRLFAGLHALQALVLRGGLDGIAVMPIPEHGLGAAIVDRLRRAAA